MSEILINACRLPATAYDGRSVRSVRRVVEDDMEGRDVGMSCGVLRNSKRYIPLPLIKRNQKAHR
ncbi:MAG: hypothetical protein ACE5IO_09400 [Thermoplasmata archaeon]